MRKDAKTSNLNKNGTRPVEIEWNVKIECYDLKGQNFCGWGYDTTQSTFGLIIESAVIESFTNSGMGIETISKLDVMATAWETSDFTKPLPPP